MSDEPTEAASTQPAWMDISAHQPLEPGDPREIGGYRLRARLGEGGMGRVYLSYTPGGRPVAVKVIRAEYADDRCRFRRRARVLVLDCPQWSRRARSPFGGVHAHIRA